MVDFHSHFLPNIDDGSQSITESLWMLETSLQQGIDTIVATPHYYPWKESPSEFLKRRQISFQNLIEKADKNKIPNIRLGAEVHYFSEMCNVPEMKNLCIEGTQYLLVELNFDSWNESMLDNLTMLSINIGITPVIAHLDRYLPLIKGTNYQDQLLERGFLIQGNAEFFLKVLTRRKALRMLQNNRIHVLGSDCHGKNHRPPNLQQALAYIEKKAGQSMLYKISQQSDLIINTSGRGKEI